MSRANSLTDASKLACFGNRPNVPKPTHICGILLLPGQNKNRYLRGGISGQVGQEPRRNRFKTCFGNIGNFIRIATNVFDFDFQTISLLVFLWHYHRSIIGNQIYNKWSTLTNFFREERISLTNYSSLDFLWNYLFRETISLSSAREVSGTILRVWIWNLDFKIFTFLFFKPLIFEMLNG